jgi:hypothetical protein
MANGNQRFRPAAIRPGEASIEDGAIASMEPAWPRRRFAARKHQPRLPGPTARNNDAVSIIISAIEAGLIRALHGKGNTACRR